MSNTESTFEDEINKIKGTIITIMGIPNDKSPEGLLRIANEISESALHGMRNVEIAQLNDVPVVTASVLNEHAPDDFGGDVLNTPIVRAASCIMAAVFEGNDSDEEIAEQNRRDAMSEEERDAEDQCHRDNWARIEKESHERTLHEIQEGVANAFDVAEKWSKTPDLTVREVAHGVAHDLHSHYAYDYGKPHELFPERPREYPAPSDNYQAHYTTQFTSEIQSRSMRAAQALFGKKG